MPDLKIRKIARPRFTFVVPEEERSFEGDPHEFVIQPFTLGEELEATRLAGGAGSAQMVALQYELLKKCVVEIDGAEVADENWIERVSPTVRSLLVSALDEVSSPKKASRDAFLASRKMVGVVGAGE